MIGFFAAGEMGSAGQPPPSSGFWDSIAAISPEFWLRLNEASGATAFNSGSGSNGTYNGTIAYQQGALVSGEPSANSIQTDSTGEYITTDTSGLEGTTGLIGVCYAGTGDGNTTARILWRTINSNTGGAYLRIDLTNITIQPNPTTGALTTSVASSTVKDGNPHLIMVGRLSGDEANLRLWIDGVNVWTHNLGAGMFRNDGDLVIARNGSSTQYCYGRYADAFLKMSAPTSSEVNAINSAWSP